MDSILSVLTTIAIIFGVVMLFNFMIFIHELGHFFAARRPGAPRRAASRGSPCME